MAVRSDHTGRRRRVTDIVTLSGVGMLVVAGGLVSVGSDDGNQGDRL